MSGLLLDTHILLWTALDSDRLSSRARALIANEASPLCFSVVSLWETAIKAGLGRADFTARPEPLRRKLLDNGFREISVVGQHALALLALPKLHRDPFDRMLVAQSAVERLTLLTADEQVARYPGDIVRV